MNKIILKMLSKSDLWSTAIWQSAKAVTVAYRGLFSINEISPNASPIFKVFTSFYININYS